MQQVEFIESISKDNRLSSQSLFQKGIHVLFLRSSKEACKTNENIRDIMCQSYFNTKRINVTFFF